jgi:lipopolysaccharide transport system ATP-binding protein
MSDTIIKVEGLGKRYFIGHDKKESYTAMRDVISNNVKGLGRGIKKIFSKDGSYGIDGDEVEEFWALKDIDFEIKRGDAVGIVGRNGAGKSTLLKILSRITEPTSGRIEINGRLSSLLEVGTGFHPELTGRENIFLNGAILGMGRAEIKRKFDEIVDFSGVEKFLDTPVKRYSSGMYVRLAFAVAANLESEILIVDEVLAVGDAEFQKKCLGKMDDVTKSEGRTVLFVSHNLSAIKKICNKGILMEGGMKKIEGDMAHVAEQYANPGLANTIFTPFKIAEIDVIITKISINEEYNGNVVPCKPLKIDIELDAERDVNDIGIGMWISHDDTSGVVFSTNTKTVKNLDIKIKKGKNKVSCLIESFKLCSGKYSLGFGVSLLLIKYYYYEPAILNFDVSEVILEPGGLPSTPVYGHVYLDHDWVIE